MVEASQSPPGNGGDSDERAASADVERVLTLLGAMGASARRLAAVQAADLRRRASDGVWALLFGLWVGLAGLVVTVLAAIYLVRGLAGGVAAAAGGVPWVGQLAVGLLVLGGTVAVLIAVRRRASRRRLEAWRAKHERAPEERGGRAGGGARAGAGGAARER